MKRLFIVLLLAAHSMLGMAQTQEAGQVELFCGAELNYADINFVRLYNVLVNLTPGVKWHLGKEWMFSAQAFLPIVNDGYESKHNIVRLTNAAVAKQLHLGNQHFKVTGGLFGLDRYGLDVRWMYPINSWLMLNAQVGYTGEWRLAVDNAEEWKGRYLVSETKAVSFDGPDRLTGIVGANVWLEPWNTEFRLSGGRYLNEDMGLQFEVLRHFRNCTVSAFAQLHEKKNGAKYKEAGGFKVVMLLPDWKWKDRKFTLCPAHDFRLTYNAQADGVSMKMYTTDPEENERTYPVRIPWGTGHLERR